jgi:hypothetical protein
VKAAVKSVISSITPPSFVSLATRIRRKSEKRKKDLAGNAIHEKIPTPKT